MTPSVDLANIDIILIVGYFIFVVFLGWYFKGNSSDEKSFFLAGNKLLWPVIGFSLFASNIGTSTLIGLAESGYSTGFAVFSYEWMASIVLVIFAVFFLPFYLKNKIYTIPEFLERRYGVMARTYFSIVTMLLNIMIDVAAGLYGGAVLLKMVFPELSIVQIIWAISIIAAFYTMMGGLASVVYTDTVQAVLLLVSSAVLSFTAYTKVGGWSEIVAGVDQEMLTIIKPASDPALPWPALFAGVFLLGFYFWVTNQFIVQRALASKNTIHGQWGAIFAGFLKLLTLFLMVLPGVMALILYPNLESAADAYPTLVFDLLPTGLLGLTLAGFTAALMSSVDSGLNAASTLFAFDIYKKIKPNADDKSTIRVAQIAMFLMMVIAALWAPQIVKFPSFWDYIQLVLAHICPPVVALFMFGLFSKSMSEKGANAAILVGVTLSVVSIFLKAGGAEWLPHYLYLAGIIFLLCSLTLIIGSLLMPESKERDWDKLIYTRKYYNDESTAIAHLPFYKNYRLLSVALVITVAIMLIIF